MLPALLLVWQLTATPPLAMGAECPAADLALLDLAAEALFRGDTPPSRPAPAGDGEDPSARCALVQVQRVALAAWGEARRLAAVGGAADLQGPVRRALDELTRWAGGAAGLEVAYAQTAVRAALAAAQDERPEMELLLTHARDLAERLGGRGRRALWPRPFNLLAGELWFEVDRYEEARAAYARAARADGGAAAAVGLARALARLGRVAEACAAYGRVREAAPAALREAAQRDLAGCP